MTEFVDLYLDPETGILQNITGARTKVALDEVEGDLSFARLVQLLDKPPKPSGDLDELCKIHGHLFQDIYSWAGQLRTVDVRKNVEGAEFFLPVSMIGRAASFAAAGLEAESYLNGLVRDSFIERWLFTMTSSIISPHSVKEMGVPNASFGIESHVMPVGSLTGKVSKA